MATEKIQIGLRIDDVSRRKLKTLANNETRSLNNMIEYIVTNYLSDYEKIHGEIPLADTEDN